VADFQPSYEESQEPRSALWFAEMMRLRGYAWLDAAQLIKHAFGLARTFHDRRTTLLYLFWEPVNASDFSLFTEHRAEITDFSNRVAGAASRQPGLEAADKWCAVASGQHAFAK
jgi:hypothetical protein